MNFGELYANRDKIDLLPSDLKKIEDAAKVKGIATDAGDKAVETAKNIPATAAAPITEPKAPITAEPSEGKLKPLPVQKFNAFSDIQLAILENSVVFCLQNLLFFANLGNK